MSSPTPAASLGEEKPRDRWAGARNVVLIVLAAVLALLGGLGVAFGLMSSPG